MNSEKLEKEITIVIPVKDREDTITRCLDSVAGQTLKPSRVIVVDNGSSDSSLSKIGEWKARHPDLNLLVVEEPLAGASAARNRGLKEVRTEYVSFFDSDDIMLPRLLEKASETIGDADLVFWKGEIVGLDGKVRKKSFYTDDLLRRQFYNAILSTQMFLAKTSLINSLQGWNVNASVWNDWELGIRIAINRPRWVSLPETLVRIYAQEKSITGKAFSHRIGEWENTLSIIEKNIRTSALSIREKKKLLDMLDYRRVILAAHYRREGASEAASGLLENTLSQSRISRLDRMKLRFIYRYTVAGGRGAYNFWR